MRVATGGVTLGRRTRAIALGAPVLAALIAGCGSAISKQSGSATSQTASATSQSSSASSPAVFRTCQGTAANGYLKNLEVKIVSCTAGRTVMNSFAKVFLDNGSRPPAVVHAQGFSCVTSHPKGDTRIDDIACTGTGDNSAVKFSGRSTPPLPSG